MNAIKKNPSIYKEIYQKNLGRKINQLCSDIYQSLTGICLQPKTVPQPQQPKPSPIINTAKPAETVAKQEKTFGFIKKKNPQVQVENKPNDNNNNIVSLLEGDTVKEETKAEVNNTQDKPKGGFSFIKSKKKETNNNTQNNQNNNNTVNNEMNSITSQLSEINFNQPEPQTKINGLDMNLLNQLYQQNNNYNANMQFQNNYRMNNMNIPNNMNNMYMPMNNGGFHGVDVNNNMNMMMQMQQMNQMNNMQQINNMNQMNNMQQMNNIQIQQMQQMNQMNMNSNINTINQQPTINPNPNPMNINQMGAMNGFNNTVNTQINSGADPYDVLFDPKLLTEQQPKAEEQKVEEPENKEPKPDPFNNLLDLVKH